ncbi:F0F1 ATP synthase subunit A [Aestuariivirga litoralis]|uniref:F0F1 ATP synthase subunit A n=1 Tax=Aestuariivirga litoralis TaxID=2650924 RepID=UPI0018C75385|nr:F0F1 ATP synthase subunit A [Aestuariivirga litoralis]
MVNDPIHQFRIHNIFGPWNIFGHEIGFTNSNLFMGIIVLLTVGFLLAASAKRAMVPGRMQSVGELWYNLIHNMVDNVLGHEGAKFFPLVFSLFSFVLVANLLGMFPYFFTVTSQVIVTASLAVFVVALVVVIGIYKHGLGWFKLFVPSGVPMAILPFISLIEIISFLSRPISLGLRLFGNMLAGHIVLKVFAGFVVSLVALGLGGIIGALAPLLMAVALTALEFLVAFLQAFVFAILTCVYLNDALHTHH